MTSLAAYMTGLGCVVLFCLYTGWKHEEAREQLWRVAAAILINWCAGMLYIGNTGNQAPWEFNLFIDSAAAFAVMWRPAGRVQGYIGLFYFFQIAAHVAYGIRDWAKMPNDPVFYYEAITLVAWAQLVALGAWAGGIWGKRFLHRLGHRGNAHDRRKGTAHPARAK